jgi:hypothetical protein
MRSAVRQASEFSSSAYIFIAKRRVKNEFLEKKKALQKKRSSEQFG